MKRFETPFICFGEILWDCLPAGIFLGGAPLNVAYHLRQQGAEVAMISAIGADFLGREARRRIQAWGVNVSKIAERPCETGRVTAALDGGGSAHYTIEPDSAWDYLAPELPAQSAPAIVFGTLALRRPNNRRSLEEIFARSLASLRVLDLNLRAPYDREPVVEWALARAQWLKLNDDELRRV